MHFRHIFNLFRRVFAQAGDHFGIAVDQHDAVGAARRGLEAERAAAGEGVQAAPAAQVLPQPVEQGLAHAVGRGPQAGPVGHRQLGALPLPADDADLAPHQGGPPTMTVTMRSDITPWTIRGMGLALGVVEVDALSPHKF